MKTFDALIVGAGPAGSAAAITLARAGYEVAIVDRQVFPREKLCGDFLNPVNRPIFRDFGVEEQLLAEPHGRVTRFRMTSCSGGAAEAEFTGRKRLIEPGIALCRARLDRVLLQRAAALGVAVYQGQRVDRLRYGTGGWRVNAGEENWQARALIGADGRNSWVARQLGLASQGASSGRAVGFQLRLQVSGAIADRVEIHLVPGGYAGVVSLGDGTVNLAMAIDKRRLAGRHDAEFLCDRVLVENPYLRSILQRRAGAAELRSVYPVYFPARRSVAQAALLVGDAARVTEPVTGEGVYFALRSGVLAADSIDRALRRGNLTASGLAGYERACRSAFRSRAAFNALLRYAVYRPALLEPVIRLSTRNPFLLHSMVNAVCMP